MTEIREVDLHERAEQMMERLDEVVDRLAVIKQRATATLTDREDSDGTA